MDHKESAPIEAERRALEAIKRQYESSGFDVVIDPSDARVPEFLRGASLDLVALKPGANVVIEVKRTKSDIPAQWLSNLRRRLEGHPDWSLVVVNADREPLGRLTIPSYSFNEITSELERVREMLQRGFERAALVSSWSLLEAVLHREGELRVATPRTPGTVVQTLATLGYITPELERRLASLIEMRNRAVHGDLGVQPTVTDVEVILSAVEQALRAQQVGEN